MSGNDGTIMQCRAGFENEVRTSAGTVKKCQLSAVASDGAPQ